MFPDPIPLDLDDIQKGVLQPRPSPYAGMFILLRIDDPRSGGELLRRLTATISTHPDERDSRAWVSVALTYQGLKVLGVPQSSLKSFPEEFQQGMAARAEELGDVGVDAPANWESPLGSPDVHLLLAALAPDKTQLDNAIIKAQQDYRDLSGIKPIWRQECHSLPGDREAFGFRDGIAHPAVEGSGIPGSNPQEEPLKAGEFLLGYPDETGFVSKAPQPDDLGRNGSFVAFRKLHQDVAGFRRYLRANATNSDEAELLAAKFVGRWRSGCPLSLSPDRDDPELGADPTRNNNFLFRENDEKGLRCPIGSHIRRMNPRDAVIVGVPRLHRMIRRGTSYGPVLPDGVLEDDGADRGLCFVFVGAQLERQFEFVQKEWVNDGKAFGIPAEKDPLMGANDGTNVFTIPKKPIRKRLQGLPRFVTTRGGEYFFAPSLSALRWIAALNRE